MRDWNDWQYFLAVASTGNLAKAGKLLGVNPTTVGRRLQVLEGDLHAHLFERNRQRLALTPTGEAVKGAAESLREAVAAIERTAHAIEGRLDGRIRIACTEAMASRHVLPHAKDLTRQHPGLELEIISGNEAVSLAERQADVAVRLMRPKDPGLMARKVGEVSIGLYASPSYLSKHAAPEEPFTDHTFVGYAGEAERWPEAGWLETHAKEAQPAARLNSVFGVAAAAAAGLGLALLPCGIGDEHEGLRRVGAPTRALSRDIWLVYHRDLQRNPKVRTALAFLTQVFQREGHRLRGKE